MNDSFFLKDFLFTMRSHSLLDSEMKKVMKEKEGEKMAKNKTKTKTKQNKVKGVGGQSAD